MRNSSEEEVFARKQEEEKLRRSAFRMGSVMYCIDRAQRFEKKTGLDKSLPFEEIDRTLFHLIIGLELMALQRDDLKTPSFLRSAGSTYLYVMGNAKSATIDEKLFAARDFTEEFIKINYKNSIRYVWDIQNAVGDLFHPYANRERIILPPKDRVKSWAEEWKARILNPKASPAQ